MFLTSMFFLENCCQVILGWLRSAHTAFILCLQTKIRWRSYQQRHGSEAQLAEFGVLHEHLNSFPSSRSKRTLCIAALFCRKITQKRVSPYLLPSLTSLSLKWLSVLTIVACFLFFLTPKNKRAIAATKSLLKCLNAIELLSTGLY